MEADLRQDLIKLALDLGHERQRAGDHAGAIAAYDKGLAALATSDVGQRDLARLQLAKADASLELRRVEEAAELYDRAAAYFEHCEVDADLGFALLGRVKVEIARSARDVAGAIATRIFDTFEPRLPDSAAADVLWKTYWELARADRMGGELARGLGLASRAIGMLERRTRDVFLDGGLALCRAERARLLEAAKVHDLAHREATLALEELGHAFNETLDVAYDRERAALEAEMTAWNLECDFCGKTYDSVEHIVGNEHVLICIECLEQAVAIVDAEYPFDPRSRERAGAPGVREQVCTMCEHPTARALIAGRGFHICDGCIDASLALIHRGRDPSSN